jgi:hypothetical protein
VPAENQPDARTATALELPARAQEGHQGTLLRIENGGISRTLSESAVQKKRFNMLVFACTPTNRMCTRSLKNRICQDRIFASDPAYAEIRSTTQTLSSSEKRLWRRKLGVLLNTSELTGSLTESFTALRLLQERQLSESTTRSCLHKVNEGTLCIDTWTVCGELYARK